jgi:Fic family protein
MPAPAKPAQTPYRTPCIWQLAGWPELHFDATTLSHALDKARLEQGKLLGFLDAIGLRSAIEVVRELWVHEAMATAAIEGDALDLAAVRSSVSHKLGLHAATQADRHVDGLIDVMQDATQGHQQPLSDDRLWRWQSALFPGGTSGLQRIAVGRYRDHAQAMEIVSGTAGREVVHYTAPPSVQVTSEMQVFLTWFEATRPPVNVAVGASPVLNGLLRAGLAHLWFESIHPFEDGNGRLGRAIVDMAIAQDINSPTRVFGVASQMQAQRSAYYDALNAAQRGSLDVTPWLQWFIQTFTQACMAAQGVVRQALDKSAFRLRAAQCSLSARQNKVLERLLEAGNTELGGGFLGGMTTDKYSKITSASKATASRDLSDLLAKGLLRVDGVGKATRYAIAIKEWQQPSPT